MAHPTEKLITKGNPINIYSMVFENGGPTACVASLSGKFRPADTPEDMKNIHIRKTKIFTLDSIFMVMRSVLILIKVSRCAPSG